MIDHDVEARALKDVGVMTPMTPLPYTAETRVAIGRLCVGADGACARGDFCALGEVAQQLADFVPEPIHCELAELVAACGADPDRATALWDHLKNELYREARE